MSEQTARIIIKFLEQLGLEITSRVEELVSISYPIVLRQVYVDSIGDLLFVIILLFLSFLMFKLGKHSRKKIKNHEQNIKTIKNNDKDFYMGLQVAGFGISLFFFLFSFFTILCFS